MELRSGKTSSLKSGPVYIRWGKTFVAFQILMELGENYAVFTSYPAVWVARPLSFVALIPIQKFERIEKEL